MTRSKDRVLGRSEPLKRRRYALVDELNDEWQCLSAASSVAVKGWAELHACLAGCRQLADVTDAIRSAPDPVLGALLSETARGDVLAGRTVLQAMLGKLVRMTEVDAQAEVDDYVAELWNRICTYPLERRPARIAANLALDALKGVHERRARQGPCCVVPWPPDELVDLLDGLTARGRGSEPLPSDGPSAEGVLSLARASDLVSPDTARLLLSVYSEGLSGAEAATRHRTTPGSVRVRCSRAVRHLAAHAPFLLDAS